MGLLDTSYAAVNGKKPRNSDNQMQIERSNENLYSALGLMADFTPVIGGLKGAYEGARDGNLVSGLLNAASVPLDLASFGTAGTALKAAGLLGAGIIKSGKNGWRVAESPAGYVGGHLKDGVFKISSSEVAPSMRGKGEGQKLYRELIDDALAKGEKVTSDSTVEMPAVRVYEALKRKGYNVIELPRGTIAPDADILEGGYYGLKDSPVFEITNTPKLTEFEQRHLTAQKNAALPIEQGGLGLPVDNTAMQRADAMGFDANVYHGTGADVTEFAAGNTSSHTAGSAPSTMHWLSGEPSVANGYALSAYYSGNPNVMPLMINKGKEFSRDMKGKGPMALPEYSTDAYAGKKLKTNDTVTLENFKDAAVPGYGGGMGTHIAVKDPANIRSRFAAFDPMRRHEADLLGNATPEFMSLLAGGGLLGLGGYSLMGDK